MSRRVLVSVLCGVGLIAGSVGLAGCAGTSVDDGGLASRLRTHVEVLCEGGVGGRSAAQSASYFAAADYLRDEFEAMGYEVVEYAIEGGEWGAFPPVIEAVVEGWEEPGVSVVVGAHYDTEPDTPGADDNASGVAGVLELARAFEGARSRRTVRFVVYPNEERPYFGTDVMGSLVHARALAAAGEDVLAMMSIEMIGYFSDEEGSQAFPPGIERLLGFMPPTTGDFIALVTRPADRGVVAWAAPSFRAESDVPVIEAVLPEMVRGVSASDHWAYWNAGFPAFMVTDTSFYRNPHYHQTTDTPDTLDYERMAMTVEGVRGVIEVMAGAGDEAAMPSVEGGAR